MLRRIFSTQNQKANHDAANIQPLYVEDELDTTLITTPPRPSMEGQITGIVALIVRQIQIAVEDSDEITIPEFNNPAMIKRLSDSQIYRISELVADHLLDEDGKIAQGVFDSLTAAKNREA